MLDHLPWPVGNALPNAAQATMCHFSHKGTLLSHVQLDVHQGPRSLSQHWFLAGLLLKYSSAWSCFFPGAALWTCPCWTSWGLTYKTRWYLIIIFAIQTQITLNRVDHLNTIILLSTLTDILFIYSPAALEKSLKYPISCHTRSTCSRKYPCCWSICFSNDENLMRWSYWG